MTTTQRPRPPRQVPPGSNPASRGLILVVVAVLIGAILLFKGGGVGFQTDSKDVEIGTGSGETETTQSTVPPSTVPATSVPTSELQVVVLNGAGKNGYAATAAGFFNLAGYPNVAAATAATQVQTTTVYYAPGFEGDADAIAKLLSVGTVQPLPTGTSLAKSAADVPPTANVVVVLGPDVEGIISAAGATTTTVAGGSTGSSGASTTTTAGSSSASTIPATTTTKG